MTAYEQLIAGKTKVDRAKEIARALDHPTRMSILEILHAKGRATVTDLFMAMRMDQSTCSMHLSILRKCGLVVTSRDGKFIIYQIDERVLGGVVETFSQLL